MATHGKQRHRSGDAAAAAGGERLQKVLAAAGLGSRRDCEELITAGRVEVDRQVVTELGTRVDPANQEVRVDGELLRQPRRVYFAVNKPVGVVTTNSDPSGRARVIDLVPTDERVFAVGRLDRSSEGLILVTNDGDFANRLTHPRYGVEKTYLVRVAGAPDQKQLARLKRGVHLAEGFAKAQSILVKKQHGQSTDLVIVLNEGRNREIRRILARVGHKVLALKRVAVGRVKLGDLEPGAWRKLSHEEVQALLASAKEQRRKSKKGSGVEGQRPPSTASTGRGVKPDQHGADFSVQKQKLLAEPLSLDDLLRDDLDEGPLSADDLPGTSEPLLQHVQEKPTGGVIDYGEDFSPPAAHGDPRRGRKPVRQRRAGDRQGGPRQGGERQAAGRQVAERRGKRPSGKPRSGEQGRSEQRSGERRGGKRSEHEARPQEDYGKKRGGKRVFGPLESGRGPAGAKTGKLRFRPKKKKPRTEGHAADNQRRGDRRSGGKPAKAFGKKGGKRKGRR